MYFYLIYDNEGNVREYSKSRRRIKNKDFIEVDELTFKDALKKFGFDYITAEDKIEALERENANLLKDSAMKDMSISMLQEENASILKDGAMKDILIETLQTDVADILKTMAQV